jgi:glucans biosynthesis protein
MLERIMKSSLRSIGLLTGILLCSGPLVAVALDAETLFAQVDAEARALAQEAYQGRKVTPARVLQQLDYDGYRDIRFRAESALWRGESDFEVQMFHPGFLFMHPVTLYDVGNGMIREVDFASEYFDYGPQIPAAIRQEMAELATDTGYAGFRLHFPLNRPDYRDEVAVFLGASYFRLVGPGHVYGLSARGLALDTALPEGEEFPYFDRFWLLRPLPGETTVTVIAALNSPSVTGAFRFDINVSERLVVDVEKRLHARKDVRRLGVAPLTSMFLFGEFPGPRFDDFRPRVHDSEGLQMLTSQGEWIWRPLANPQQLRVVALQDQDPAGFGLMQRRRDFREYLDLEAQYHRRPSHWVEPAGGDWEQGAVVLVEIPADSEIHDNIVAFWEPARMLLRGEERHFRYRLHVFDAWPEGLNGQPEAPDWYLVRVRQGWGKVPGMAHPPPQYVRRYIVDFAPTDTAVLGALSAPEPSLVLSHGRYDDLQVKPLPAEQGWRVSFLLEPEAGRPADMRLQLRVDDRVVSETWNHVWYGDEFGHTHD